MSGEETTPTNMDDHQEEEQELTVEMFRACMDPGRKKSLRSLEIPLDNLLSGIIFTAGGRDLRGGPVLVLTQPSSLDLETLMEISQQDAFDMLAYFTSVPSEDCRGRGFTVVLDGEVIHDFLLRIMIRGLAIMHTEERLFHRVLFVSSVRDITQINWRTEYCSRLDVIDLPFQQVSTYAKLQQYIDPSQLTPEFGGTLTYNHHDWVRFRMQVEPFLCDCISISKHLARAIEPFTEDSVPSSVEQVEESIQHHHLMRRKTLEALRIDQLTSEGSHIDQHMQLTASSQLSSNPDFSHTLSTISGLLTQIGSVKDRMEILWDSRHDKLQTSLKQRKFEKEAGKVIEWFEEYAEEFFQTHTELGDSVEVAQTLAEEVQHFEESTQDILATTADLLSSGEELGLSPHAEQRTVSPLMGKIRHLLADFDNRLAARKQKLDDTVRIHRLTEEALDWCIESASLLSSTDMLGSTHQTLSEASDARQLKAQLDQFLQTCPPPSEEVLVQLQGLAEDQHWARETAAFACHRVQEVKDKFNYVNGLLDQRIQARELPATDIPEGEELVGVARIGQAVTMKLEAYSEADGETSSMEKIRTWDSEENLLDRPTRGVVKGGVTLRHPHKAAMDTSLHYDDVGAGHAMMLLRSVADRADAKLKPPNRNSRGVDVPDEGAASSTHRDTSPYRDTSPHRISKEEISQPSRAAGPLFSTGSAPDSDEEDNLRAMPTLAAQRKKIMDLPCPQTDNSVHAQTKNAKHRRKLMEELIQTEETYIRDMEWVVEHYMPAMDDIASVPRNLVGKKNYIFSTLPQLLQLNKIVILPQLQSLSKCPIKLGMVFMTLEEDLLNYSLYFKNLPQQTALMEEGGIQFFADVSERVQDRFFLNSYLIKPFQRITKYKIFIEEMIKHSNKGDLKGKLKEYYDKLKEAQKMVDFILRHGNDLLAVECLRGFEGNMMERGKVLRQGDLVLVDLTKHHRRMFLFENTIILAKKGKVKHQHHEVAGSEIFDFKQAFKTSAYALRENVEGHASRFQLYKKKETLTFQAETVAEKCMWVQDIWDLFFSHMLSLKDQNLEAHGSLALTSLAATGSSTIGRSFGHSLRRAMSVRHSSGSMYGRRRAATGMATSNGHRGSPIHRLSGSALPEDTASSPSRNSGTFVDLRPHSYADLDNMSDRSSIISSSSVSTISSMNMPPGPAHPAPISPSPLNGYASSSSLTSHVSDRSQAPSTHRLSTTQRLDPHASLENHRAIPRAPSPLSINNMSCSPLDAAPSSSSSTSSLEGVALAAKGSCSPALLDTTI